MVYEGKIIVRDVGINRDATQDLSESEEPGCLVVVQELIHETSHDSRSHYPVSLRREVVVPFSLSRFLHVIENLPPLFHSPLACSLEIENLRLRFREAALRRCRLFKFKAYLLHRDTCQKIIHSFKDVSHSQLRSTETVTSNKIKQKEGKLKVLWCIWFALQLQSHA